MSLEFERQLEPQTAVERELVERLVGLSWRIRRVPGFEAAVLEEARAAFKPAIRSGAQWAIDRPEYTLNYSFKDGKLVVLTATEREAEWKKLSAWQNFSRPATWLRRMVALFAERAISVSLMPTLLIRSVLFAVSAPLAAPGRLVSAFQQDLMGDFADISALGRKHAPLLLRRANGRRKRPADAVIACDNDAVPSFGRESMRPAMAIFRSVLTLSTCSTSERGVLASRAVRIRAVTSLGKQDPP